MKISEIYHNIIKEMKELAKEKGFKKYVLGLSGGLDSAVVAALAVKAYGSQNITAVALPTQYNSPKSMTAAKKLAKNLKIDFKVININDTYEAALRALKKGGYKKPASLTEQNIQPRIRTMMLMAVCSELNAVMLNCGNKSEVCMGYATLYGDTAGAFAPIGDLYKTEVYELARYINKDKEIIPGFIITRPPSAELKHGHKDEDDLPPYTLLDKVLSLICEGGKNTKDTAKAAGISEKEVKEILTRKERNAFKLAYYPPAVKVKR
ncbi:NAD+ synthase (glutamine-hydrolyzing) [Parelusimicrobium proximum]|uniref:NAD(+) synthase n=1 Tax=Parelusimicrobium proximum TaxID=3228953 RepID=UPI003D16B803